MEIISREQWNRTHRDYKSVIDGQKYILKMTSQGTSLVPVKIMTTPEELENKLKKMAGF